MPKQSTPAVTVLMSVYNGAPYLPDALDSLRSQSYPSQEIVIVDDASTDDSPNVLDAAVHEDHRIRVLRNPVNLGLTRSLNRGLHEGRGAYIVRLDADDMALPGRIEKQVSYLEAHPETAMVCGMVERIDERGEVIQAIGQTPDFPAIAFLLLVTNPFFHSATAFRRKTALALGGYDESIRYSQDYDLWLRLSRRYRLAFQPDVLSRIRSHGGQISSEKQYEQRQCAAPIWCRAQADIGLAPASIPRDLVCRYLYCKDLPAAQNMPVLVRALKQMLGAFRSAPVLAGREPTEDEFRCLRAYVADPLRRAYFSIPGVKRPLEKLRAFRWWYRMDPRGAVRGMFFKHGGEALPMGDFEN